DRGGTLQSLKLKKYARSLEKDSPRVDLVNPGGARETWPLGVAVDAGGAVDLARLPFAARQEGSRLTFAAELPGGLRVEKRFSFHPDSYLFSLEISITNATGAERPIGVGVSWADVKREEKKNRYAGHAGPVTLLGTDVERVDVEDIEAEQRLEGRVLWTGYETKYFLAAMVPDQPDRARVRIFRPEGNGAVVELYFPPAPIPAGATTSQTINVYTGPKAISRLKTAGVGLEQAVDFGIFAVLAKPLLWTLNFFQRFVKNYGVAIILLTILIRIAFFPLATKQFRSMKEMQRLQPLLQELREKYKEDRERLNQETMQLFRTHKVNPLGGCFPILLQIPVFIALYQALLNSIALRQAPFVFWLKDLSAPDPTYVTPILMTGSMFLQQKMSPPAGDPTQQKIMMFMPLIFGVMFLNFPSGLVIYWLANNLLAIAQQAWINRRYG
ncbi:MAG: membrane protein insertase YidC, partial [Myxococcota bacterium]